MTNRNKTARLAGLLYLILVVSGILNLAYIPSQLIVWDDAAETLATIRQSESLFRWGIVSGIIMLLAFTLLSLVLYRLLHEVNRTSAALMVTFVLISIPLSFANLLHKIDILTLIGEAAYLRGLDEAALQFQVMDHLHAYNSGIGLSQVFWGLWLLPFGYLVYRSGFLPKLLGILLMLGCLGYLIEFFGDLLFPGYHDTIISTIAGIPASIGEIGICLWLVIAGAKTIRLRRSAEQIVS